MIKTKRWELCSTYDFKV